MPSNCQWDLVSSSYLQIVCVDVVSDFKGESSVIYILLWEKARGILLKSYREEIL